jgi:6-phosphofructokinase
MDNDILWVWQSFGFMSAVEQARQSINQLATEARSNPRVCVIQLFGSVSGFVVSHAALGSDACDLALIPEMDFSMSDVCRYMKERLKSRQRDCAYGLVVMAETAIPNDFEKFKDKQYVGLTDDEKAALEKFKANARQFRGQTPDALRTAALKLVSRTLQRYIHGVMGLGDNTALDGDGELVGADSYWNDFRVFTNEPRHIIRSMEPSVTDVAYGIRLGTMAVDTAMAGYTDCMVSQWLTEYVVVPPSASPDDSDGRAGEFAAR